MSGVNIDYENRKITLLDGSIRSLYKTSCGKYWRFKLNNKQTRVHRYIAENFISNENNLPQVNHIDGNTENNSITNLEWCTHIYNLHHAMDNGLHNWGRTAIIGTCEVTGEEKRYNSQTEAEKDGFIQANIYKCLKGLRPRHKKHTWRYA